MHDSFYMMKRFTEFGADIHGLRGVLMATLAVRRRETLSIQRVRMEKYRGRK